MLTLVKLSEEYTEALCTNLRTLLLVLHLFQIKVVLKIWTEINEETHYMLLEEMS